MSGLDRWRRALVRSLARLARVQASNQQTPTRLALDAVVLVTTGAAVLYFVGLFAMQGSSLALGIPSAALTLDTWELVAYGARATLVAVIGRFVDGEGRFTFKGALLLPVVVLLTLLPRQTRISGRTLILLALLGLMMLSGFALSDAEERTTKFVAGARVCITTGVCTDRVRQATLIVKGDAQPERQLRAIVYTISRDYVVAIELRGIALIPKSELLLLETHENDLLRPSMRGAP